MAPVLCYFGTYEADYDRNRIVQRGLRENGVEVLTCHRDLWGAQKHKTTSLDVAQLLGLAARVSETWAGLAADYLRAPEHDAVVVGYLGHLDVLLAAPLCRLRGKPLIFDAFISLYDTLVHDRGIVRDGSPPALALRALDRLACELADVVLLDTDAHANYFADELGVPRERCHRVLVGADPDRFGPPASPPPAPDVFTVLHYSKFAPLHGLRAILEAAKALEHEPDVRFLLVGGGQLEGQVDAWCEELGLSNVERRSWMEPEELTARIATAGACLGIFGDTGKASRVIPNKVYQYMAVGSPIVTRDSSATRELLRDGEHALLCPPADSGAIVTAIRRLREDPTLGPRLASNARALYLERCTPASVVRPLLEALEAL